MVVFFRTLILYTMVVIVMRIMGKRQIGELQPFELVIAIMLSELASVPMQDTGIPLTHGIIPIVTLTLLEVLISYLTLKFQPLRSIVCGSPSIVIRNGVVQEKELAKLRFNLEDLMEDLRILGYMNFSDIEYAIMETCGKLSVVPKAMNAQVTRKDLNIRVPGEKLPVPLILDGVLYSQNLKESGRSTIWLNTTLKENGYTSIENVFIAMLDSNGELFIQGRDKNV